MPSACPTHLHACLFSLLQMEEKHNTVTSPPKTACLANGIHVNMKVNKNRKKLAEVAVRRLDHSSAAEVTAVRELWSQGLLSNTRNPLLR